MFIVHIFEFAHHITQDQLAQNGARFTYSGVGGSDRGSSGPTVRLPGIVSDGLIRAAW
jgi:hypothetical protein